MIGTQAFQDAFWNARESVFRLESLQHYAGDPNHARYEHGEPWQQTESKNHWVDLVSRRVADGVSMQRVRLVTEPWTSFTAFELTWSYPHNTAAGEDIRVIAYGADERPPRTLPQMTDFWLFDEAELWWLSYDMHGALTGVEREDGPRKDRALVAARGWRRTALAAATPLDEYVRQVSLSA